MPTAKKAFALNGFTSAVSFIVQLGSATALSRILAPEEIGTFSVALSTIALLTVLREFGAGNYILQKEDLSDDIVRSVLGVTIVISWTIGSVLFFAAEAIASFYEKDTLSLVIRIISLNFVLVPFISLSSSLLLRNLQFFRAACISLVNSTTGAIVCIALALQGLGVLSLALGSVMGTIAAVAAAATLRTNSLPLRPSLRYWREITAFGSKIIYNNVLVQLGQSAPDLIIGKMLGMEPVAMLNRASAVRNLIVSQFIGVVNSTFTPIFAAEKRLAVDLQNSFLQRNLSVTAISLPMYAVLIPLAGPLIVLFFGVQWLPSVPIAQVLCALSLAGTPLSLLKQLIQACGQVGLLARMETFILIIRVISIIIGSFFGLIYVAYSLAIEGVFYIYFMSRASKKIINTSGYLIYIKLWKNFILSAVTAIAAWGGLLIFPDYQISEIEALKSLICAGSLSGTTWIAGLFLIGNPIAKHLTQFAQNALRVIDKRLG